MVKGSTLDVGVISINLRPKLVEFKVDTKKEWTPFSMSKRGKTNTKKFSDHLGIKLVIKMKKIPEARKANKEIINYRNKEGWKKYKVETDKVADTITAIAQDDNLNIDARLMKHYRGNALDEGPVRYLCDCGGHVWISVPPQLSESFFRLLRGWS